MSRRVQIDRVTADQGPEYLLAFLVFLREYANPNQARVALIPGLVMNFPLDSHEERGDEADAPIQCLLEFGGVTAEGYWRKKHCQVGLSELPSYGPGGIIYYALSRRLNPATKAAHTMPNLQISKDEWSQLPTFASQFLDDDLVNVVRSILTVPEPVQEDSPLATWPALC